MELQTVTIFRNWVELAADLPSDKERGQFYHAVCLYALEGQEPDLSGIMKHYFQLIRPIIDKSAKRKLAQEKSVAKRKETSSQTESQNNLQNDLQNSLQKNPQTESQTESQTQSQTECVSIRVRVREKELSSDNSKKNPPVKLYPTFTDLIPECIKSEKFIAKWREWEHYRRNRKKPISEAAATKQLKMLSELSESGAIAAIDQSIQNDYQGIFPPKGNMPNNKPQPKKDFTGI